MTIDPVPEAPPAPRSLVRRLVVAMIRVGLLVYIGVALIFLTLQARMIFPGSVSQGKPDTVARAPAGAELVTLTASGGDRVVALFGPALGPDGSPRADAARRPTLLFFYGNGNCLADQAELFGRFRRLGLNVMIPDYLGYGMSGGQPSEVGCRETAEAALAHLASRADVDRSRIVAAGWSLGGAVAVDLASRQPVAGLAVFSTFTRMVDMAKLVVPFLPASLLLRHRFESLAKISAVECPVLIGHGRLDRMIPYVMADRLADAAEAAGLGPVARVTVAEADHNDFFDLGGRMVLSALGRFAEDLPRRP
jgi:fermentation-respiration switch protein FrsA (DUF1100 family)